MSQTSFTKAEDVVRMNRAIVDFDRLTLDNIHQFSLDLLLGALTLTDKPIMGSSTSEQAAVDSLLMAEIVWGTLKLPAMELIRKVGLSGSYLVGDHTLQRCRSEFVLPKLSIRTDHANWRQMKNRELAVRAAQYVKERIAAYQQPKMETTVFPKGGE